MNNQDEFSWEHSLEEFKQLAYSILETFLVGKHKATPSEQCLISTEVNHLASSYTEMHRTYHNYKHICDMLKTGKHLKISDCIMDVAILYHDIIYVPGANVGVNEELSARRCELFLDNIFNIDKDSIQDVKCLIEYTSPNTYNSYLSKQNKSVQRIQSLDLYKLADINYDNFVNRQRNILMEYNFKEGWGVTDIFFKNLLKQDVIFKERSMMYMEFNARYNMEKFLKENY